MSKIVDRDKFRIILQLSINTVSQVRIRD